MDKHAAGPQAAGYLYQVRYALLKALQASEETRTWLETLDDVVLTSGGAVDLFSLKHHFPPSSLSDASPDVWKTLHIWCLRLAAPKDPTARPTLTLVTTGVALEGSAMSFLRHGPDRDCARAMSILEATAHSSTNQTLKPAFDAFRSLTPALRKALLESIDIIDNTPNIIDIRNDLLSMLRVAVRPQHRASALERLEGWWFNRVAHMLKPGGGSPLAGFELFEKLRSIAEQFTPDSLPIDYATAHPPTQPDPESDQRRFVLQLKCLSVSPKRIENAILDYYRASQQRGRWAREELLVGDEVAQFEAKLVDEWERMRLILIDDSGRTAAEEELRKVGLDLLKWMETVADVRIRPNVTADYVRRGSYHMLAEDDPARVWWHPLFAERIQALLSASVST